MYFSYRTITPYGIPFQVFHLYIHFVTLLVKRRFYLTTPSSRWNVRFKNQTNHLVLGLGCFLFARRY